jgi:glycosyltransferase involved in cell wall biosynthesis
VLVLHLTGWPIPETVGGTEVYVESLCRALAGRGTRCAIGFPDGRRPWTAGEHDGLPLHRYAPVAEDDGAFQRWLRGVRPDVVHVHSFTEGLQLPELEAVHRAGFPLVMTVHLPGMFCHTGTMLRNGRVPCDGRMEARRCCRCTLHKRGLPLAAGHALTCLPPALREGAARVLPRKCATALRMPATLERRFAAVRRVFALCERVVAVCQWLLDALRGNGAPADKLVLSRQATDCPAAPPARLPPDPSRPLRVGFLGRFEPLKGAEVLLRAVASLPREVAVRAVVRGVPEDGAGGRHVRRLQRLAAADARIDLGGALPRAALPAFFSEIDLLAVPSTCLETGPLVVYEALAHGMPVLGSRLGGIAELVRDGADGWLLPAGDVAAWRRHLADLAAGRKPLPRLDKPHPALRTWAQAAQEMTDLYRQVVSAPALA